jgi:general secretion pathway protein C
MPVFPTRLAIEIALLACVVALVAVGVSTSLQLATWSVPPATVATPAVAAQAPLDTYAVIAARDLFNPVATAAADTSTEGLRLRGVGFHGGIAHAIIDDDATGRQELYRVGDALRSARVAAIAWDQVTMRGPAGEITLELATDADGDAGDEPPVAMAAAAPAATIRQTGADAFIVDRRELAGAVDNMSGLLTQLRAVAEVEDGRPAGFRLFQIKDDSIFHRLGLENGDVVQRVNGNAVGDPSTLLAFLQRLRTEPRVALDIVRGGSSRTLVYDLR